MFLYRTKDYRRNWRIRARDKRYFHIKYISRVRFDWILIITVKSYEILFLLLTCKVSRKSAFRKNKINYRIILHFLQSYSIGFKYQILYHYCKSEKITKHVAYKLHVLYLYCRWQIENVVKQKLNRQWKLVRYLNV